MKLCPLSRNTLRRVHSNGVRPRARGGFLPGSIIWRLKIPCVPSGPPKVLPDPKHCGVYPDEFLDEAYIETLFFCKLN